VAVLESVAGLERHVDFCGECRVAPDQMLPAADQLGNGILAKNRATIYGGNGLAIDVSQARMAVGTESSLVGTPPVTRDDAREFRTRHAHAVSHISAR
jgi:hypothetical protein